MGCGFKKMSNKSFIPLELSSWNRLETFNYYTKIANTTYSINLDFDVSETYNKLKEMKLKFFPTYLYLVTTVVNKYEEFRIAKVDNILGYWDKLTPAYPIFHEEDNSVSLLWSEYIDNYYEFYQKYISDTKAYKAPNGILSTKGLPLANSYIISCIPWVTFNSFSLVNHGISDYFLPSFEASKFKKVDNRILMPLSITVHHATIDGYNIKKFVDDLQFLFNNPKIFLDK